MAEHDLTIPRTGEDTANENENDNKDVVESVPQEEKNVEQAMTKEESEYIEKVFFEEDDSVRLRDGIRYKIPPLSLKDAKSLMKKLNTIDTGIILANLIADESGSDSYDELMGVLIMAFKPYYKDMTTSYLEDYVDIGSAKEIIDIMIGLNGLKKSL